MKKPVIRESESFWDIVWKQFKKRKSALISLYIIALFFVIAVFAPFIANDKPIWMYGSYKELYRHHYAAWEKNHESYVRSFLSLGHIRQELRDETKRFALIKAENAGLTRKYDESVNDYASLREGIAKLDERISGLKSTLKAMKKQNGSNLPTEWEIKALNRAKSWEDWGRKYQGGRQTRIKKDMLKKRSVQSKINLRLVQLKMLLDERKRSSLILSSLSELRFYLNDESQGLLDKVKSDYRALFSRYREAWKQTDHEKPYGAEFTRDSGAIYHRMTGAFTVSVARDKLEKRILFPVLDSLNLLDILFMSIVLSLALLPILNRVLVRRITVPKERNRTRWLVFISVTVIIGTFISLIQSEHVPSNYKKLLSAQSDRIAMFPPVAFGYNENSLEEKLQKPTMLTADSVGRHIFGTDGTGRDVLSRMIWGSRVSLSVGFVAVSIYVFIGIIVGAIAGYFGGWVDILISRFIEVVICFPAFFLILTIIAFVGPSIFNIMIIIGLTGWTGVSRLVRGEFLKLRDQDFVLAAKSLGVPHSIIIFRHILPNALTPVLVSATFGIASAMLTEASLSFLGFGVRDPFPSWGQMISSGQFDVLNYSWLSIIPGIAIFISVTTYNLVGEALRESIDPRLRE